jgi:hypothetical protein
MHADTGRTNAENAIMGVTLASNADEDLAYPHDAPALAALAVNSVVSPAFAMNTVSGVGEACHAGVAASTLPENANVGGALAGYSYTTRALAANPKERLADPNDTPATNAISMNTMADRGSEATNSNASSSGFAKNPCTGVACRTVHCRNSLNRRGSIYGFVCHFTFSLPVQMTL